MIGKSILEQHFETLTVPTGEKLFMALEGFQPDVILLDVDMPHEDGYETISKLKANRKSSHIPIIFLSARDDPASHERGFELGAIDFVLKPYSPTLLIKLIERHLQINEQQTELLRLKSDIETISSHKRCAFYSFQDSIYVVLESLLADNREIILPQSNKKYRDYLALILDEMHAYDIYKTELDSMDSDLLITAAQLYDIGKIAVKSAILQKPGRLTVQEFELMKQHTFYGPQLIESITHHINNDQFLEHAKLFASSHHERWDGSGYPSGLEGKNIPLQGRIMALIDVYSALTSERPYKLPVSSGEAKSIIQKESKGYFDPLLVDIFLHALDTNDGAICDNRPSADRQSEILCHINDKEPDSYQLSFLGQTDRLHSPSISKEPE